MARAKPEIITMDIIITLVNNIPDNIRYMAMDLWPGLWDILGHFFTIYEDGSITLP